MKNIIFYLTVIWPGILAIILAAISIFGLSYYVGYIEGMGFNYSLFPLDGWDSAIVWAYFACREYTAHVLKGFNISTFFITVFVLVSLLFWFFSRRKNIFGYLYFRLLPKKKQIFPFVRWLLNPIIRELLRVFEWSYYFILILSGILYIYLTLITIPDYGKSFGQSIAIKQDKHFSEFEKNLCEQSAYYRNPCITVPTSHLKESNLPDKIEGSLIAKSETMLGIYTKNGPITMSMPEYIYYKSIENKCFDDGCKK